jgi:hypothetical protein
MSGQVDNSSSHNPDPSPASSIPADTPSYRVAQDLAGDWWVWRRTSNSTWTTFRRCETEDEANAVRDDLNAAGH